MLALLVAASLIPPTAQESTPPLLRWYVAPDGDDTADGTTPRRSAASGPFRTLRRAFDEVRATRSSFGGELPAPVLIELLPGRHELDAPLVLEPEDGGDERHAVHVFAAPSPETKSPVVVCGGRRIGGWRRERWLGQDVFVADLPAVREGWRFRELWIDGRRRPRARHPSSGCLEVAGLHADDAAKPWNEGVARFRFAGNDLDPLRADPRADVVAMCRWIENHVRVAAIDFEAGLVTLREPTVFKLEAGDPYYLEGARGFLDAPGEWWLDEELGRLHVLPRPGEDLARAEVIAPRLERLVTLAGEPERGHFVQNVRFENLAFRHCEWWFPGSAEPGTPRASGFPQAALGVPGAITALGARRCRFEQCAVTSVGGYAIELGRGCTENVLLRCELTDLGGGGVKIGEPALAPDVRSRARENSILECRIGDAGRVFHSAVGIWIGQSPSNRIERNEIHDLYYTGISIGWTWGYGGADADFQSVRHNHVHHVGRRSDGDGPILSDLGGVYTLGLQRGTTITGNWFHDVAARRYGGWGIYLDEGSSEIEVRSNLVCRTTHGGFHQHYGRDNLVAQNVFAYGRDAQIQRTRCEPHSSFRFARNVVLWKEGELFAGDLSDGHLELEENLYWREDRQEPRFAGRSFAEWQSAGFDRGSKVADPRFAAPDLDEWTIGADSPAAPLLIETSFVEPVQLVPWSAEVRRRRR